MPSMSSDKNPDGVSAGIYEDAQPQGKKCVDD